MQNHRTEHRMVVSRNAKVTCEDETILLAENQSIYTSLGTRYRLENPCMTWLQMVEVRSLSYLGEEDIVRFEDSYGHVFPIG